MSRLENEMPANLFSMWIRPLQAIMSADGGEIVLLAPNKFIVDWVRDKYLERVQEIMGEERNGRSPLVKVRVGSSNRAAVQSETPATPSAGSTRSPNVPPGVFGIAQGKGQHHQGQHRTNLRANLTFENFVEGKSNRMAAAAAQQVAENPGSHEYNPLLFYGGVGLGKTHLMHAVGNAMLKRNPNARIVYVNSERFFGDMVSALRNRTMPEFKRFYRSVNALLIDDIQFFAAKSSTQEEFFHTFNALLENGQQIILTCDKFPKEIDGLEERLKSRFGWGLSQQLEPPELETRVAILKRKAEEEEQIDLPDEAAFFIASRIRSNVRDLEGALRRIMAHVKFTGTKVVDVALVKEVLKDLLAIQARQVNIDNIQRIVAEYYKIRVLDLLSARRTRSLARPRQVAMALAKELTTHSFPEIGEAFGGRDHTTVIYACKQVAELRSKLPNIEEDYQHLLRSLSA